MSEAELERLFEASGEGSIERQPIRPAGVLSDFATETLPGLLADVREGRVRPEVLDAEATAVVEAVDSDSVSRLSDQEADLASLDVNILVSSINGTKASLEGASGQSPDHRPPTATVPEPVFTLAEELAARTGKIPSLSYEDLIMINPLETDPRVTTTGLTGELERRFYLGHLLIEDHFADTIDSLRRTVVLLESGADPEDAAQSLGTARRYLEKGRRIMGRFHRDLDAEQFNTFRPYFSQVGPHIGPSGRFTARFPVIDTLMAGDYLPEERYDDVRTLSGCFPRSGYLEIVDAVQDAAIGMTVRRQIEKHGDPDQLQQPFDQLVELIKSFRRRHHATVRDKLGDVLEEIDLAKTENSIPIVAESGSVEDIEAFLRGRIDMRYRAGTDR